MGIIDVKCSLKFFGNALEYFSLSNSFIDNQTYLENFNGFIVIYTSIFLFDNILTVINKLLIRQ